MRAQASPSASPSAAFSYCAICSLPAQCECHQGLRGEPRFLSPVGTSVRNRPEPSGTHAGGPVRGPEALGEDSEAALRARAVGVLARWTPPGQIQRSGLRMCAALTGGQGFLATDRRVKCDCNRRGRLPRNIIGIIHARPS